MNLISWCKQDLGSLSLMDNIDQRHHARMLYEAQRKLLCTLLDIEEALEILEPKANANENALDKDEDNSEPGEEEGERMQDISYNFTEHVLDIEERTRKLISDAWLRFSINACISSDKSGPTALPLFQSALRYSARNEMSSTQITGYEWESRSEGENVRAAAVAAGVPKSMAVGLRFCVWINIMCLSRGWDSAMSMATTDCSVNAVFDLN